MAEQGCSVIIPALTCPPSQTTPGGENHKQKRRAGDGLHSLGAGETSFTKENQTEFNPPPRRPGHPSVQPGDSVRPRMEGPLCAMGGHCPKYKLWGDTRERVCANVAERNSWTSNNKKPLVASLFKQMIPKPSHQPPYDTHQGDC